MKNLDKVTLIDKNDNVVGEMDKVEAHRGEALLHRASSVFLFRKNPQSKIVEVLFQKRSAKKIVGARQWGNTVCGNVRPTENYKQCALRRLKEEIGFELHDSEISDVYNFIYHLKCNDQFSEYELDHVFVGEYKNSQENNSDFSINPNEVEECLWLDWSKLLKNIKKLELIDFPQDGVSVVVNSSSIYNPTQIYKITINPWTLLMLSNNDLIQKINKSIRTLYGY